MYHSTRSACVLFAIFSKSAMFIRVLPFLDKFINQPFQFAPIESARSGDVLHGAPVFDDAHVVVVNALKCKKAIVFDHIRQLDHPFILL
jgi:hypothetical protein